MSQVVVQFDRIIPVEDIFHPGFAYWIRKHNLRGSSGLYFFYNASGELLYLGWSRYLTDRIRQHLKGNSRNTKHFIHEVTEVRILWAESFDEFRKRYPDCVDIEYYLIHHLNPKYNASRPNPFTAS
ncbi:GIY-YIG nuclease family protein [Staphylospora marina]|uniref:GIY-YIG nuclease family protein n=1 Tax=Staphylospora marina TaxID=2490858 RepID=UPI0013DE6AFC|nr:GIY-YIG nuclease family protein [Staphylospora marina]